MATVQKNIIAIVLAALILTACGGGDVNIPEPEPVQPTTTPTALPIPTATPLVGEATLSGYESSNQVFHIKYPTGWVINEVPTATGLAFAVAPNREFIDNRPDFRKPVLFGFGTINQVSVELAQPANLPNLHKQAFSQENSGFAFVHQSETVTRPSAYITYFFTEAISTTTDGAVVRWKLGTGLADLTVVHFGVGVSQAGFAEYSQLALDMFNSVEIDTAVTAKLAGK
jgi:hypothetical protein